MALLLDEIRWGEPVVPPVTDAGWDAEVKRRLGAVPDHLRRLAPIPWLRRACLDWGDYPLKAMPVRLADISMLITAQENSCRYCYGAARAHLRILGHSERFISALERDAQLAEMDPKERAFIHFCRQLARSKPRPGRDELIASGFSPLAVAEIAFHITNQSFHNRVATFIASPPAHGFERAGRSVFARLLRPIMGKMNRHPLPPEPETPARAVAFQPIVDALAGLPAAALFARTMNQAFESPVLSTRVKALMFAVVARQLECPECEPESRRIVLEGGLSGAEFESTLATLGSPKLDAPEARLLEWVRETVHYEPLGIQGRTHALVDEIGAEAVLEAIGIAALANATVRLATLLP